MIAGAAHCSDMYPPYDKEPAGLPAARDQIRAFLEGIICELFHWGQPLFLQNCDLSEHGSDDEKFTIFYNFYYS